MRPILLALLFLACPFAARAISLVGEPDIDAGAADATIHWKTDAPSGGKVRWGENEGSLDQSLKDGVGAEHRLTLPGLKRGTRFFFTVGTARDPIGKGSFTTKGGQPDPVPATKPQPRPVGRGGSFVPPRPAQSAAPATMVPPTRATWGNMPALQDHFDRHGADFAAKSPDDYAAKAWLFREQAVARKLPMKQDGDTVRIMDLRSLAFAAFNGDGTTKTYFRPRDASYWDRQPGRPISTPPWAQK